MRQMKKIIILSADKFRWSNPKKGEGVRIKEQSNYSSGDVFKCHSYKELIKNISIRIPELKA